MNALLDVIFSVLYALFLIIGVLSFIPLWAMTLCLAIVLLSNLIYKSITLEEREGVKRDNVQRNDFLEQMNQIQASMGRKKPFYTY